MREPVWLTREEVLAFHEAQLREHGGLAGVRDEHALEGALARAQNVFHYGKADLAALAAAYAHGIAKNHPFNDGNKRAAFISAYVFLGLNGIEFTMTEPDAIEAILGLAEGKLDQDAFADFVRKNMRRAGRGKA